MAMLFTASSCYGEIESVNRWICRPQGLNGCLVGVTVLWISAKLFYTWMDASINCYADKGLILADGLFYLETAQAQQGKQCTSSAYGSTKHAKLGKSPEKDGT
jgi:hypothetical protein